MTAEELTARLARRPEMCQAWVAAVPLRNDGGVVYVSSVTEGPERIGMTHVYIWDRAAMGRPGDVRRAARTIMRRRGLDRLVGEIDSGNRLAINLARRVGFREIGTVRRRRDDRGARHDVMLMDALPEDLGRE